MKPTKITNVSFHYAHEDHAGEEAEQSDPLIGVHDITLTFPAGSCTVITGPSGSGKSTILKLLNGLIPELHEGELTGEVHLAGYNTQESDLQQLGRIAGMVFQNPRAQFFTANVTEELAFASENAGEPPYVIVTRIHDSAHTWGIGGFLGASLGTLSGGELQQVACAAAIAGPQRILLLDEPTSNLSPEAIERFTSVLRELIRTGWTIVIAEHRVYPLRGIADQVVVMRSGRVVHMYDGDAFFSISDEEREALGLRTLCVPVREEQQLDMAGTVAGVEVRDLKFSYGSRKVLAIEHLALPAGRVIALTGPNGAGKTTFAKTLMGLSRPHRRAEIRINGVVCSERERQKRCTLVMQDVNHQLFGETVISEVHLGNPGITEDQVVQTLAELGLEGLENRHPMTLSGGQKQRLMIASALMSEAELYVFDEPTSGVDFEHLVSISTQIRKLANKGKTVLVISHDVEFINRVADYELRLEPLTDPSRNQAMTWR